MTIKAKLVKAIEGLENHYITGNTYEIHVGNFADYNRKTKTKTFYPMKTVNHRGVIHPFTEALYHEHFQPQ